MQYNKLLKEIAVIKTQAMLRDSSNMAFLSELLPCDTGLEKTVYQLAICFTKKETKKILFKKVENALAYMEEYLANNSVQDGFMYWDMTGLED